MFYHSFFPFIDILAATEPNGEKMHLRASLSHFDTAILCSTADSPRKILKKKKNQQEIS
jgi:hypothetical protein